MIVPAAGLGTRLGGSVPKLLVPVGGVPMIDRLLALFTGVVAQAIVVAHPSFEQDVRRHLAEAVIPSTTLVQPKPTGMLDAIMLCQSVIAGCRPDEIWIAWCDQVAIHPDTIRRLASSTTEHTEAAVVMPTVASWKPYTHLERDANGRITKMLHRREGDAMPETGESDMGLFALSREGFSELLPRFARHAEAGSETGERNFLPFIPWVSSFRPVVTFPSTDRMEALGINTPEDLRAVEGYLAQRSTGRA